ncbi:redoxin domain-containing protein [Bacteroidota bacterium]
MKKIIPIIQLIVFLLVCGPVTKLYSQAYEIKVKFKTYQNNQVYLGFHYGNNKFIRDTAEVNNKGIAVFSGKEAIPGGIYLIIIPDKNYFEFIFSENKIYMETDTGDFVANMNVIESEENKIFYSYLRFMQETHIEKLAYEKQYELIKSDSIKVEQIKKDIRALDQKVIDYRQNIINTHPDFLFSKVLAAMVEPEPRQKLVDESDSVYTNYLYGFYQLHYFDNIDLSDERILRTPVYEPKVDRFLEKMTIRHPDSIKYAASRIIDKAMANEEVFKYTLIKLFNYYAKSKYMGMDAVVVYLAERYYLSGKATWADSTQKAKIYDRVVKLSSNLIGMKAPELIMQDTSGQYRSLHSIKAPYTVIVFWDVSCSHCRASMPILKNLLKKTAKDSLEIFAVYIGKENKEWKTYLKENKLPFINVSDPNQYSNFRTLYDVYSTPVIYILDKDKIIQAKRIGAEQVEPIINTLENRFDLVKPPTEENKGSDD